MSTLAACPACAGAVPLAQNVARDAGGVVHILSLPGIHCAACIAAVEAALHATPGIRAARVNLSRRRVRVVAAPGLGPETALAALRAAGFEAHELDEAALDDDRDAAGRLLLARIAVAGFAMMNVMALSVAVWSGATDATRGMLHWVSAAIALPALVFAAVPFFASAWGALRGGRVNMDVPIALAIALAAVTSLVETIAGHGADTWFDAALSLTFFLLAGRYLDHRARATARSAAAELTALEVPRATRLEGDRRVPVAVADIAIGDVIALSAGARAPVDGITDTPALVDRSALTGEATPLRIAAGDPVCAGDMVLNAPLTLTATARAEDSTLRRIAALVDVAESARHRHSGIADRAAKLYAPLVHGLAALTFAGWWGATGDVALATGIATAVLIITCPCALGLAVPAVTATMTGRLFRRGVLLKSATALERLAEVDCVLLDKTGTLTKGSVALPDLGDDAACVALALAQSSGHPIARRIAGALQGTHPATLTDIHEVAGEGVHALWNGAPVFLGRGRDGAELHLPGEIVALPMSECLRAGAAEMVAALRQDGIRTILVTGDTEDAARDLTRRLGIADIHAGLRPEDKAALVDQLSESGHRVLMIGDGLNDTVALARAHMSMAPASALDAARVASDTIILSSDLRVVSEARRTACRALRRIRQNLFLAAAYNAIAIPIALAGLASPLAAAIAMSSSSITVVTNAVRP